MNDLISRKEAIKAIENVPDGNWRSIRYSEEIKKLPCAKPEWIPVSERMPEEGVDVLCSIHFKRMDLAPNAVEWFVDICHYRDNEWYTYFDDDAIGEAWHDVVAWMPLPQCYKENQL